MNVNHKLITLALAFSLLGSTCAFARPTLHFEDGHLSHEKKTVASHVPTAKRSGATGCSREKFCVALTREGKQPGMATSWREIAS
jgi:hypothetical protein